MSSKRTQVNEINGWWIRRCMLYYYTCNSTIFFQIIKYCMMKMFKPPTQSTIIIHDDDRGQHSSGNHWRPGAAPIMQMKNWKNQVTCPRQHREEGGKGKTNPDLLGPGQCSSHCAQGLTSHQPRLGREEAGLAPGQGQEPVDKVGVGRYWP